MEGFSEKVTSAPSLPNVPILIDKGITAVLFNREERLCFFLLSMCRHHCPRANENLSWRGGDILTLFLGLGSPGASEGGERTIFSPALVLVGTLLSRARKVWDIG